jgi:mannose/cellobiose epimerase-like protein (N-acyl-D-glucosamine 2-epimerase family)
MRSSASASDALARLTATSATLRTWLFECALPLWWRIGADRFSGGFYEKLDPDGDPVEEPRRARVVARQLFVYATAARMGWRGPASDAVHHALLSLQGQHLSAAGRLIPLRCNDGHILSEAFDLYDHAFALFGLAAAASAGEVAGATQLADALRQSMTPWKHPVAGYEEAVPRSLPLKANPHMHMLEACLAWEAVSNLPQWRNLADEIGELALARFIDPASGALHEFFDGDWARITDSAVDIVEPGHQFEWAWLLLRWGRARNRADAAAAAHRLTAIGEGAGVDRHRGLAIDGLTGGLEPLHTVCRLWPQTERIKAWALTAALTDEPAVQAAALSHADEAASGLLRYVDHPVPGSWWENIGRDGAPLVEPARASSLYHIVCAISELETALNLIAAR